MQELFSAYLLHRLDNKSRAGLPGHRGGRGGRGRSGGRRGSGKEAHSGQSSDRCTCHARLCLFEPVLVHAHIHAVGHAPQAPMG